MIDEITTDVYDITIAEFNGGRYRVFLFNDETPTLVDAGLSDTTDVVVDQLTELNVEPERLIITHGDPDHIGGFSELTEYYGLETWVPNGVNLEEGIVPDNRYSDGDTIGRFTAAYTPGHTPNHHALVDEEASVAVLGDAVFGSTARGLPEGYFVLPPGYFSADLNEADKSLNNLLEYEFDIGLVYHGTSVTSDASTKLEQFVNFEGKPE